MEKWDLYTKYREKTGAEHIRGDKIPEGCYHLIVHVWIRNSKGEYLISQRAANRPTFPLMWECVGGSVIKGESSLEGALREVKEEVGLDLDKESGKILFSKIRGSDARYESETFNDIMDVWLFPYDGELQLEAATTDEVADCKWMTVSEIKELYEEKKLVQTLDYFFCAVEADGLDDTDGTTALRATAALPAVELMLGKEVKGIVDRPAGTVHLQYPGIICSVNYGYVEGVLAGNGEKQRVYILGTDKPLRDFEGKVIAVWHRFDTVEDIGIVSLDGKDIADERILGEISFQEQFFYGKLLRCGI